LPKGEICAEREKEKTEKKEEKMREEEKKKKGGAATTKKKKNPFTVAKKTASAVLATILSRIGGKRGIRSVANGKGLKEIE